MKCLVSLLLISGLYCQHLDPSLDPNLTPVLKSVIENEKGRKIIHFVSCWEPKLLVDFSKQLSKYFISFKPIILEDLSQPDRFGQIVSIIDLNCENGHKMLGNEMNKLLRKLHNWIIIDRMVNQSLEIFDQLEALPDNNIILISKNAFDSFYLRQFYRIDKSFDLTFEDYGTWSKAKGLDVIQKVPILSRRRKDLKGRTLKAPFVLTDNRTLRHLDDFQEGHIDSMTKVGWQITSTLVEAINATKNFYFVKDWGYPNKSTGKWSGMVGELIDEADFGGTACYLTPERVPIVDYMSPSTMTSFAYIFRAPKLSYVTNIYALPFNRAVWVFSGLLVLGGTFVVYFFLQLEQKLYKDVEEKQKLRFSDIILLVVGAICQMGSAIEGKFMGVRIITLALFVALLFLFTSYTASIVALLQSTTDSIRTPKDLLDSKMEAGAEDLIYSRYFLSNDKDPIKRAVYQRKVLAKNNFFNASYGIHRVKHEPFAFHVQLGIGYRVVEETFYEHEKCGLMEIPVVYVKELWTINKKDSPYKEIFKINLFKINEHGIKKRINKKIYTKKPPCVAQGQNFTSVSLSDCYFLLLILGYGYLLAFIVFCIEKMLIKKQSKIGLY